MMTVGVRHAMAVVSGIQLAVPSHASELLSCTGAATYPRYRVQALGTLVPDIPVLVPLSVPR